MRKAAGLALLQPNSMLDETARRHAEDLAARGEISHFGSDRSTVLDRWRAAGGTSLRIGEIVGAGGSLPEVESAWEASHSHCTVVLDPLWTHVGWGSARMGAAVVYVVLFSRIATGELVFGWEGGQFTVRGSFTPREAESAVLFCGIRQVGPVSWDRERRSFVFRIASADFVPYLRLGYRTASGDLILTDAAAPRGEPF